MNAQERDRLSQQCMDVLGYLDHHEWITHRDAETMLGVMRLAARICDLKKQGYQFEDKWIPFTAANGRIGRIKGYKKVA